MRRLHCLQLHRVCAAAAAAAARPHLRDGPEVRALLNEKKNCFLFSLDFWGSYFSEFFGALWLFVARSEVQKR
jgi:hypothetical protein